LGAEHKRVGIRIELIGDGMNTVLVSLVDSGKTYNFLVGDIRHVAAWNGQIVDVIDSVLTASEKEKDLDERIAETSTHEIVVVGSYGLHSTASDYILARVHELIGLSKIFIGRDILDVSDPSVCNDWVQRMIHYRVVSKSQRKNPLISCFWLVYSDWAIAGHQLKQCVVVFEEEHIQIARYLGLRVVVIGIKGLLNLVALSVIDSEGSAVLSHDDVGCRAKNALGDIR